jgi:hypothetical protein
LVGGTKTTPYPKEKKKKQQVGDQIRIFQVEKMFLFFFLIKIFFGYPLKKKPTVYGNISSQ